MASFPSESPGRQVLRPQGDAFAMLLLRREGGRERLKTDIGFSHICGCHAGQTARQTDEAGDCACDADLPVAANAVATNSEMRRERARDDKKRVRRRRTRTRTCDVPWSCGLAGMAVARFNGPALETSEEGDGGREGCHP